MPPPPFFSRQRACASTCLVTLPSNSSSAMPAPCLPNAMRSAPSSSPCSRIHGVATSARKRRSICVRLSFRVWVMRPFSTLHGSRVGYTARTQAYLENPRKVETHPFHGIVQQDRHPLAGGEVLPRQGALPAFHQRARFPPDLRQPRPAGGVELPVGRGLGGPLDAQSKQLRQHASGCARGDVRMHGASRLHVRLLRRLSRIKSV